MATTEVTRPSAADLMRYEDGDMEAGETVDLYARLIATGMVWHLQGAYGRYAVSLIEEGLVSAEGEVLVDTEDL